MTTSRHLSAGRDYLVSNVDHWNSRDPASPVPPKPTQAMLITTHRFRLRKKPSTFTTRLVHEEWGTFHVPGYPAASGNMLAMHTIDGATILVPPAYIRGEWEPAYAEWVKARSEHSARTFDSVQSMADRGAEALKAARALIRFGVNPRPDVMHGTVSMSAHEAQRLADLLERILR